MVLVAYLVTALVAFAGAAKLNGCSGSCIGNAITATGCASSKSHCICSSDLFLSTVNSCVANACSKEEQDTAISLAEQFCKTVGGTQQELKKRDAKAWGEGWQGGEGWGEGWGQPKPQPKPPAPPAPPKKPSPPPPHPPPPPPPPPHTTTLHTTTSKPTSSTPRWPTKTHTVW